MSGSKAIVRGVCEVGCSVAVAYPGTARGADYTEKFYAIAMEALAAGGADHV